MASRTPRLKDSDNLNSLSVGSMRQMMRDEFVPIIESTFEDKLKPYLKTQKQMMKALNAIQKSLGKLQRKVENMSGLKEYVEKQSDHTNSRFSDIYETVVPAINTHIASIATALTKRVLDLDVHRRKWSLNIQGVSGIAGEEESATRAKVVDFAINKLRIRDAAASDFGACHRLSQEANSGIILKFLDLSQRNAWLDAAKNLKHFPDCKVSISPDLPNDLRPLKTELLNKRKNLPPEQKKNSSVRFLKQWPYVELRIKNHPTIRPSESITNVCERVLDLGKDTLLLNIPEPEREPPEAPEEPEDEADDDDDEDLSGDESTLEDEDDERNY